MTDAFDSVQLHRSSTADQVAALITQMIIDGRLTAGSPLRESKLSEALGVSRNSIREAIRILEQGRLVSYAVHRGAVVNSPSTQQLRDLYQARGVLECSALDNAIDADDVTRLRNAYETLETESQRGEYTKIVAADLAFHRTIVGFHHNERLSSFFSGLQNEMFYYFSVLSWVDEQYKRAEVAISMEHRGIFEAIENEDLARAQALLHEHIEKNRARLEEILVSRLSDQADSQTSPPSP